MERKGYIPLLTFYKNISIILKLIIMARKDYQASRNGKKVKGTGKKPKQQTEYQRTRDAEKARKKGRKTSDW